LREVLEDDFHLIEAETGEGALTILQERQGIDLVLLDYLLPPGIDGLEILRKTKELEYDVPVVMVTGKGSEEVAVEAFRFGSRDYIVKPFKVKKLREIISKNIPSIETYKSYIDKAIEFIEMHYHQPISTKDVSINIGLSLSYLEHVFKKKVGHTVTHHIVSLRIDEAKKLLLNRNLLIKEIAAKVGFKNQNYFCSIFKKYEEMTPTEYREQIQ
jgi:two-component system response regulator YesN